MTACAGKSALDHDRPRFFAGLRITETRYVGVSLCDAILENPLIRPLLICARQFGIGVNQASNTEVSLLHQHVTHIQKEALKVVRRDPRIPASALGT